MSRYAIIALVFVACVAAQANSYSYGAKGRREVQAPMKTQYTQYQQPEPVVAQQAQPVAVASAQQPFVAATKGGSQSFYAQEPLKTQYAQYQQQPEVVVAQQPQPMAAAQTVAVAQQAQPLAVASAQQPFVAATKGGSQTFYTQEPLKTQYAQYQHQPEVVVAQPAQATVVAHRQQYETQQPFVAATKGGSQSFYAQEPLKTQYAQYQQQPEVVVAQQPQPAVLAHRQQYETQQPFVAAAKGQSFYAHEPLKTQYTQYQQQPVVAQPAQAAVVAHKQYEAQQPFVAAAKGSQSFYAQEPAFKGQYQPAAQSSH